MALMIGRAWVKVAPHTKGFREETIDKLRRELDGIEKDLGKDGNRVAVKTEIDVDRKKSAANFRKFYDSLEAVDKTIKITLDFDSDLDKKLGHLDESLSSWGDRLKPVEPKVEPTLDVDPVEREMRDLLAETDRMGREAAAHVERVEDSFEDVGRSARDAGREFRSFADEFEHSWRDSMSFGEEFRYVFDDFRERAVYNFEVVKEKFRNVVDGMRNSRIDDLEVDLDLSTFEGNLQRVRHGLQEIKDDYDDTDIEFHPVLDETSYRSLWARLKWLTRDRIVVIHPVVNKGAAALAERTLKAITLNATGLRNAGRALKNFFEYLERLDKNAPVLGMIATGIAAIGGAAIAAVGSVSHLAVELVRMAGAGLALPGILGGFAVGIGVFVTAIKNLNKEVPKVRQDLDAMAESINQKFWNTARVPLLEAWNKVLPSLEKGFDKTASALGRWTAAMATGFADNLRPESMNYMFDNLAKSIDIASESADDLGRIMEILGKRGSEYLPRLAAWTNDLAAGFRDWLDEADRTGRLNEMIETGITKLKEFGVLVREAGELIYILGSAAERAGFSGLKEMSEGLEQVNEDLRANQDTLDDYFAGSANMADGFKSLIGSIVDGLGEFSGTFKTISSDVQSVFEDIGDAIEDVLGNERFQQGVEDLFGGIKSAVEDLTSVSPELGDLAGSIASLAGSVVENIGSIGAEIVESFGPEAAALIDDLEGPIDDLSDALEHLIDVLGGTDEDFSIISTIGTIASWASTNVLDEATAKIEALADALEGLQRVLSGDWGGFAQLGEGISELLLGPLATLNRKMGDIFGYEGFWAFDDWFGSAGEAIGAWVTEQIAEIGGWLDTLGRWVSTAMGWVVEQFESAWNRFWHWLTNLFSGEGAGDSGGGSSSQFSLTDAVADRLGLEDLSFDSLFEEAKSLLLEAWEGFKGWLGDLFGGGGGDSGGGGSTFNLDFVLNAIDNASTIVSNVGQTIRTWAAEKYEAILTAVNRTATAISNAKTAIVNWAKAKYEAALTAINRTATGISNARTAIVNWARRKYEAALTALNRTGTGISNAVSAIRSRVVNATFQAKVTMSSIVSGLSGVVSKIRNAVSNFTANVRTRFSSANGNVFPAVKAFANGGLERHVAQIARPSVPYRVWAEPETGGEAYIPLALAKRERSTAILADVADRFGYRLEKFANGSEPRGTQSAVGGNTYNLSVQTLRPDVASEVTSDVMFHLKHMAYGGGRQDGF